MQVHVNRFNRTCLHRSLYVCDKVRIITFVWTVGFPVTLFFLFLSGYVLIYLHYGVKLTLNLLSCYSTYTEVYIFYNFWRCTWKLHLLCLLSEKTQLTKGRSVLPLLHVDFIGELWPAKLQIKVRTLTWPIQNINFIVL